MRIDELRAEGDRDLATRLLENPDVRRGIERVEGESAELGARRALLGTALRLSPEMAPALAKVMAHCSEVLEIEAPIETYVYPGPSFNAATLAPERGRILILISSSLLESFDRNELAFVIGHELGHHRFGHHAIPVEAILEGDEPVRPSLALELFAWQRLAEISSDRVGLVAAKGLAPAARALFKLASGLRGDQVEIRIDQFLSQVGDLEEEAGRLANAEEPVRSDWFATHPFSPLRLRALELFSKSGMMVPGGTPRTELEAAIEGLMSIMRPSYLQEKSDEAESMRRLLVAGAILVARVSAEGEREEVRALEMLLGPGSLSGTVDAARLESDLPSRIDAVRRTVPALRRAQIVRDLCVVARADGRVTARELDVIRRIAESIGVDWQLVRSCTDGGCRPKTRPTSGRPLRRNKS